MLSFVYTIMCRSLSKKLFVRAALILDDFVSLYIIFFVISISQYYFNYY